MRVRVHRSPKEFLDFAESALLIREGENSLILGIALRLRDGGSYGNSAPTLITAASHGAVRAAAVRTPPYHLVLAAEPSEIDAIASIADRLRSAGETLPGVQGTPAGTDAFADRWYRLAGVESEAEMELRLYRLTEVIPPLLVPGVLRPAGPCDLDLLSGWAAAFAAEAVPGDPPREMRDFVGRLTASGALFVWDDGGPVSMAASTRPTPNGISVNLVYTPPALRRRGYASACVAELSQRLLDSGRRFCTLFTNLANPTSNRIYRSIGFRPVADFRQVRFRDRSGAGRSPGATSG